MIKGSYGTYKTGILSAVTVIKTKTLLFSWQRVIVHRYSDEEYTQAAYSLVAIFFCSTPLLISGIFLFREDFGHKDGVSTSYVIHRPAFYSLTYSDEVNSKFLSSKTIRS